MSRKAKFWASASERMEKISRDALISDLRKEYEKHARSRGAIWPFLVHVPGRGMFYLHEDGGVTQEGGSRVIMDLRSAFDEKFNDNPRGRSRAFSAIYERAQKMPKYSAKVSPVSAHGADAGKMLRQRLPKMSKEQHAEESKRFAAESNRLNWLWEKTRDAEHRRVFGRAPEFHDYKISGIGRDEYSEPAKKKLRGLAHKASAYDSASIAHWRAAGKTFNTWRAMKAKLPREGEFLPEWATAKKNPRRRARPVPMDTYAQQLRRIGRKRLKIAEKAPSLFQVQLKRGSAWVTLAGFYSQPMAMDYAKAIHARYPSHSFRVFKPDGPSEFKKNPADSFDANSLDELSPDELNQFWAKFQRGRNYRELFPKGVKGAKKAVADLANYASNIGTAKRLRLQGNIETALQYEAIAERIYNSLPKWARGEWESNPIQSVDSRVAAAARRFKRFTGHEAAEAQKVEFPKNPGAGLAVGPVLLIGYETVRDGKRERYIHRFSARSRPLMAVSHDGSTLYLLGGAYRFTERGIVDKR